MGVVQLGVVQLGIVQMGVDPPLHGIILKLSIQIDKERFKDDIDVLLKLFLDKCPVRVATKLNK